MFYITKKDTETGKKLLAVEARVQEAFQAQKAMGEKYGFAQCANLFGAVAGGISFVVFDKEPDKKIWKKYHTGHMLRSVKAAQPIWEEFKSMPVVEKQDLNKAVGYGEKYFTHIGVRINEEYCGFEIPSSWDKDFETPPDCTEVTRSVYRLQFEEVPGAN